MGKTNKNELLWKNVTFILKKIGTCFSKVIEKPLKLNNSNDFSIIEFRL